MLVKGGGGPTEEEVQGVSAGDWGADVGVLDHQYLVSLAAGLLLSYMAVCRISHPDNYDPWRRWQPLPNVCLPAEIH